MKVYIVRHGESEANAKGIVQGRLNSPLSDKGRRQALKFAASFSSLYGKPDKVYVSDLARAYQTGLLFTNHLCLPKPTVLPMITERSLGELEGVPSQEFYRWHQKHTQKWWTLCPKHGEKVVTLEERALKFLRLLKEDRKKYNSILAVSHSAFILAYLKITLGWTWAEMASIPTIKNCALTEVDLNEDDSFSLNFPPSV